MTTRSPSRSVLGKMLLTCTLLALSLRAFGEAAPPPAPAWDFTKYFQYNIEDVLVSTTTPGTWNLKIIFSVTNPNPDADYPNTSWNIQADAPFRSAGSSLTIDIGWASDLLTNTGSANPTLTSVSTLALGTGAAMPIQIRNLTNPGPTDADPFSPPQVARPCTGDDVCPGVFDLTNRFYVVRSITPVTFTATPTRARIGIEGKPVCNGPNCPTSSAPFANIPVRSAVADVGLLATATPTSALLPSNPRRQIVDFATKCRTCHNGTSLDKNGAPIPRLSLHGNNRNENLDLCVICHNPNQTDVNYRAVTADPRTSLPEVALDFKRMIHSIHAADELKQPLVVVGFNSAVVDFGEVAFPKNLRNCVNCHLDSSSGGTFELPLPAGSLGSTVVTQSTFAVPAGTPRSIDVNPANDLKISPVAAVCSGCHDDREATSHMKSEGGASFATLQQNIGVTVKERCAVCHGPGKEKGVRKVHDIKSPASTGSVSPKPESGKGRRDHGESRHAEQDDD